MILTPSGCLKRTFEASCPAARMRKHESMHARPLTLLMPSSISVLATFRDAALCAEATASIVNLIAILSGRRDP